MLAGSLIRTGFSATVGEQDAKPTAKTAAKTACILMASRFGSAGSICPEAIIFASSFPQPRNFDMQAKVVCQS